jgi:hypothetical protein
MNNLFNRWNRSARMAAEDNDSCSASDLVHREAAELQERQHRAQQILNYLKIKTRLDEVDQQHRGHTGHR